jgi:hypothetical protein
LGNRRGRAGDFIGDGIHDSAFLIGSLDYLSETIRYLSGIGFRQFAATRTAYLKMESGPSA